MNGMETRKFRTLSVRLSRIAMAARSSRPRPRMMLMEAGARAANRKPSTIISVSIRELRMESPA
jgi:hypothetical protein